MDGGKTVVVPSVGSAYTMLNDRDAEATMAAMSYANGSSIAQVKTMLLVMAAVVVVLLLLLLMVLILLLHRSATTSPTAAATGTRTRSPTRAT